jgi:hypothetical protein
MLGGALGMSDIFRNRLVLLITGISGMIIIAGISGILYSYHLMQEFHLPAQYGVGGLIFPVMIAGFAILHWLQEQHTTQTG